VVVSQARGQAFTLEALVGALLLLSGLVFALQVTAVTPLSASTSSQHIENQQQAVGEGVLAVADEHGELRVAILSWAEEDGTGKFHNASGVYFVNDVPDNGLGEVLEPAFRGRGVAYNVYVEYRTDGDGFARQRLLYRGEPSDNAVSAARTVTLYDNDVLYDEFGDPTTMRLGDAGTPFYAPDTSNTGIFNTVRVEIVVWRM
jgi:hypothetical protein